MSQGRPINPRHLRAAHLYIFKGMTQGEIAEELGVERETVNRWMNAPSWVDVTDAALKRWGPSLRAVAYRRLKASAEGEPGSPGVTAANSLLNRIEGPVPDKVEANVAHSGEVTMQHDLSDGLTTPERLATVAGILGSLGLLASGATGDAQDGTEAASD